MADATIGSETGVEETPKKKRLIFIEGLLDDALSNEECVTFRRFREESHSFEVGDVIEGEFEDGLTIPLTITRVSVRGTFDELMLLSEQPDSGFVFDEKCFVSLCDIYDNLDPTDAAVAIFFQITRINGIPAVRINKHMHKVVEVPPSEQPTQDE